MILFLKYKFFITVVVALIVTALVYFSCRKTKYYKNLELNVHKFGAILCVFVGAFVAFHQFTPEPPQITTDNWKENGNSPYYQLAETHVELKYSIKDNKAVSTPNDSLKYQLTDLTDSTNKFGAINLQNYKQKYIDVLVVKEYHFNEKYNEMFSELNMPKKNKVYIGEIKQIPDSGNNAKNKAVAKKIK